MTPQPGGLRPPLSTDNINVAVRLRQHAQAQPDAIAIREPISGFGRRTYVETSFGELIGSVIHYEVGLHYQGIAPGMRVVLMIPPSRELIRLVYALLHLGAVIVLVDPGIGIRNLGKCLDEAQPEAFIGIRKAQFARHLFGWAKSSLRISITVSRNPAGRTECLVCPIKAGETISLPKLKSDDPAAILFTSGSTGVPKGAVYTHGIFSAQLEQLQSIFGIEPGEVDLCTFPLFALFAPALGMTSIIPRMDFTRPAKVSPQEILKPAMQFDVTNLFGSPALINRVGRAAVLAPGASPGALRRGTSNAPHDSSGANTGVPTLKRVLSAGAPVSPQILERFQKLLAPGVQIYTPYGATESLPVAVIGSEEVLNDTRHKTAQGAGTCVGKPVPGIDVKILRISDEPIAAWSDDLVLPPGEIGEICVYGPVVTQEYFRRPDLTALAKIPDASRGRKWHRMGDVGYFDEQGRLWFCGRKSQRVVTAEKTYFTDPIEGIFNAHPAVFRSALVGVKQQGTTQPLVCIERQAVDATGVRHLTHLALRDQLLEHAQQFPLTKDLQQILIYPADFPVDIRHNSKIFREKLAAWAQKKVR